MTSRLVTLFALVAIVTFAGVGTYLYQSLSRQLQHRDDMELTGKSKSISHLVRETGSVGRLQENRHAMLDTVSGHDQLVLLIVDVAGEVIVSNHDGADRVARALLDRLQSTRFDTLQNMDLPDGHARFIASQVSTSNGETTLVMLARTASDHVELLARYHSEVWYAASIGTALATLLSFFFVRSGLKPLRLMATQTHAISANHLDTRLDIASAPSELHDIVESFNAMLDRLHRSFEQLTQFSGDLAHDLRTPLNNLMVQTQVALSRQRSLAEYQSLLSSNVEEYERLARMMESMLFLARAENAHVAMTRQTLILEDELAKIADYFEGIAQEANVGVVVDGTGEIFADPMLLRRALGNLVANAIRYTPANGVIRVEATELGETMVVTVSNPGETIPPELIERIFDRFYRADPARSSASGSSGLGLAIVRSIMALHGGEASVKSIPGAGTIFRLAFPKMKKTRQTSDERLPEMPSQ